MDHDVIVLIVGAGPAGLDRRRHPDRGRRRLAGGRAADRAAALPRATTIRRPLDGAPARAGAWRTKVQPPEASRSSGRPGAARRWPERRRRRGPRGRDADERAGRAHQPHPAGVRPPGPPRARVIAASARATASRSRCGTEVVAVDVRRDGVGRDAARHAHRERERSTPATSSPPTARAAAYARRSGSSCSAPSASTHGVTACSAPRSGTLLGDLRYGIYGNARPGPTARPSSPPAAATAGGTASSGRRRGARAGDLSGSTRSIRAGAGVPDLPVAIGRPARSPPARSSPSATATRARSSSATPRTASRRAAAPA